MSSTVRISLRFTFFGPTDDVQLEEPGDVVEDGDQDDGDDVVPGGPAERGAVRNKKDNVHRNYSCWTLKKGWQT